MTVEKMGAENECRLSCVFTDLEIRDMEKHEYPICSMYDIFTYMLMMFRVNVGTVNISYMEFHTG